jgi:hypothetical protein
MATTKNKLQNVFLAASGRVSLDRVRDELTRRGVEVFSAYETAEPGAPIQEQLEASIRKADLVLAIIDSHASANVFFELGLAKGLGKKVLLLVSPNYGQMPAGLASEIYVRTEPSNRDAIAFALDQVWGALSKPTPKRFKLDNSERPLGNRIDKYWARIEDSANNIKEVELERVVVEILKASGVATVHQGPEGGADIAVWSDDLQPILANPMLIEVKSRISDAAQFRKAVEQIESYRRDSDTRWALLIIADIASSIDRSVATESIFVLTIGEFLNKLRDASFSDMVRDLRNRRVHGGAF